MKSNNKVLLAFIAVVGIVILAFIFFYLYGASVYDGAVERKTNLDKSWANVQAVYQRRADLVPNLVATVQGAADNEKEILTETSKLILKNIQRYGQLRIFKNCRMSWREQKIESAPNAFVTMNRFKPTTPISKAFGERKL
jgi:hypothetical protein